MNYKVGRCRVLLSVLFGLFLSSTFARSAETLVWTDKDNVQVWRSDADGSNPQLLYSNSDGLRDPRGIAVDPQTGAMYIADNLTNTIYRGNLDGSGPLLPWITGQNGPADIALGDDYIYWADQNGNRIRRASHDGTNVENVLTGLDEPYYVTVDDANDYLYWTDFDSGIVHRAGRDGSSPTNLISGLDRTRDIELELDGATQRIYWADRDRSEIRRQNLDGTGNELLFSAADGLGRPHGLWLDGTGNWIYWTDTVSGDVLRGSLDGAGSPQVLFNGAPGSGPWELQLVVPEPTHMFLGLLASGVVIATARRRRACR